MDSTSGESELTETMSSDPSELVSHSCELDDGSPDAILDVEVDGVETTTVEYDADGSSRIKWATPGGLEVAGRGVAARFVATGPDRFDVIKAAGAEVLSALDHDGPPVARPRAFGGFSFHDEHEPVSPWTGFEAAAFVIPRILVVDDGHETWLTVVDESRSAATSVLSSLKRWFSNAPPKGTGRARHEIRSIDRSTSREAWTNQVRRTIDRIDDGRLEKVVLAQSLTVDFEGSFDVTPTLSRLGNRYPNCYRFLVEEPGHGTFFGAPPEQLVRKRGSSVTTEALAGSAPRGETPTADDRYGSQMLQTMKYQFEHELVVDAIRSQLEPFSRDLTVADQTVRKLATIQHLRTPIRATLDDDRHVLELVEALHPTPAVGGVPPDDAWETIRSTEPFDRGWYAAPVGWFDGAGDGEFAAGIRSAIASAGSITLYAGNGIVAESDPAEEWDEVQLKFRPILDELR